MKESERKSLLKHIKKDDKEFRSQIKDDEKLKAKLLNKKKPKKKEKEEKSERGEKKEKREKKEKD